MKKRTLVLMALALIAGGLLSLGRPYLLAFYLESRLSHHQSEFERQSPENALMGEVEGLQQMAFELGQSPLFSKSSYGNRDASGFMQWLLTPQPQASPLHLPPEIHKELNKESWMDYKLPKRLQASWQSQWVDALTDFDHWNFDTAQVKGASDSKSPDTFPPQAENFVTWGRAHLLAQSKSPRKLKRAFSSLQHISELLLSTDHLKGVHLALDLQVSLGEFFATLSPDKQRSLDWQPLGSDLIKTAKDFYNSQPQLYDPRLSNESFLLFYQEPMGRCLRLRENLKRFIELKRLKVKTSWEEGLGRLQQALALTEKECRPELFRQLWQLEQNPYPPFHFLSPPKGLWDRYLREAALKSPPSSKARLSYLLRHLAKPS